MATKEELLDSIGDMTVMELAEFVDDFKDRFGVTAVAAAPAAAGAAEAGAAEEAEEQTAFDVVLTEIGGKKIQVIKAVREVTDLGLKEAKDVVDNAPQPVKEGIGRDEAEQVQSTLEEQGATVELK